MNDEHGRVEFWLARSAATEAAASAVIDLEVSIEVEGFSGHDVFPVRWETLERFLHELAGLVDGVRPSARLDCAVVAADEAAVYFMCQIDRAEAGGPFTGQVSLGTGGGGLLRRLHVGLRVRTDSLGAFQRELSDVVLNHAGRAVIRVTTE